MFEWNLYIGQCPLWVYYACEQKCKQWHQQGFDYNNGVFDSNVMKHPVLAH